MFIIFKHVCQPELPSTAQLLLLATSCLLAEESVKQACFLLYHQLLLKIAWLGLQAMIQSLMLSVDEALFTPCKSLEDSCTACDALQHMYSKLVTLKKKRSIIVNFQHNYVLTVEHQRKSHLCAGAHIQHCLL